MGLCGVGEMMRACFEGASFEMLTQARRSPWPTLLQIYTNRDDDEAYKFILYFVLSKAPS